MALWFSHKCFVYLRTTRLNVVDRAVYKHVTVKMSQVERDPAAVSVHSARSTFWLTLYNECSKSDYPLQNITIEMHIVLL